MSHHEHFRLEDIRRIIDKFEAPEKVKEDCYNVYKLIAEAESYAHQEPVEMVHFHEVGTIDAIVDIFSVCYLLNRLGIEKIETTPIATGYGKVKCAHGILDVPAPATAYLLRDLPHYSGDIKSELCTPTGAALLKYFSKKFVDKIPSDYDKIGIGFGKKQFDRPNVIKAYLYDSEKNDEIILLQANIDDMTGEEIGYAFDKLLDFGARDVYIENVMMKKNRPGIVLNVLVSPEKKDSMIANIFKLTTTLGIREFPAKRYVLDREIKTEETPLGKISYKESHGYGTTHKKREYEDLKKISEKLGLPFMMVNTILDSLLNKDN